jgi:hypothetical protein
VTEKERGRTKFWMIVLEEREREHFHDCVGRESEKKKTWDECDNPDGLKTY